MNYNKKSVEDIEVSGKRVLVRCDFNVPLKDGVITSTLNIFPNTEQELFFAHIWANPIIFLRKALD